LASPTDDTFMIWLSTLFAPAVGAGSDALEGSLDVDVRRAVPVVDVPPLQRGQRPAAALLIHIDARASRLRCPPSLHSIGGDVRFVAVDEARHAT
jgi:hypothetical protein